MASKRKELVRAMDEKAAEGIAKIFDTEPEVIEDDTTDKLKNMSQRVASAAVQGKTMDIVKRKLPSYQGPEPSGRTKGDAEPEF